MVQPRTPDRYTAGRLAVWRGGDGPNFSLKRRPRFHLAPRVGQNGASPGFRAIQHGEWALGALEDRFCVPGTCVRIGGRAPTQGVHPSAMEVLGARNGQLPLGSRCLPPPSPKPHVRQSVVARAEDACRVWEGLLSGCPRCKPAMCMPQEVQAIQHHSANTKDRSTPVKVQKARRCIAMSSSCLRFLTISLFISLCGTREGRGGVWEMLVLVADTQMIGAGSREGGGCRAWKGVVVHVGSGACQRRKGCSFERTGARVEKRDAQRVRTYQPPLVIVLAPLKRRLESHVRRHRARWGWRGAARCELRLKRGGKRAPRGQHERDRKQAQHPGAGRRRGR